MTDAKALAYVNLYGVLGCLENLCGLDSEAKAILAKLPKPVSLCFYVSGGPCATLHFTKEGCTLRRGQNGATCKLLFPSPAAFNQLIATGTLAGIPVKGPVQAITFLLGTFVPLTDRLTKLLRPSAEDLRDRAFFEESTLLTLYTVAGAISALANHDPISKVSAQHTVDGDILLGIRDRVYVTVRVKNSQFTTLKEKTAHPRAVMEFADIDLANALFNGTASSINELCKGRIHLRGMISMVDNVNRILDRVAVYLA